MKNIALALLILHIFGNSFVE